MSWRDIARPIIAKVLQDNAHRTEKEIKEALHAAYPFGMRQYHPYKTWLDEIRVQRGLKEKSHREKATLEGQTEMFA